MRQNGENIVSNFENNFKMRADTIWIIYSIIYIKSYLLILAPSLDHRGNYNRVPMTSHCLSKTWD